jgi:5-methylcytosine-specific restriction endonuclease McrA
MPHKAPKGKYPGTWGSIKNAIMRRDNFMCQECGQEIEYKGDYNRMKPQHFRVHHRDGNKSNNDFNNLILLCKWCHGLAHRRINVLAKELA